MSGILKKNLQTIKKLYGEDYLSIIKQLVNKPLKGMKFFVSKDGMANVELLKDNRRVFLHSKYDVQREVENWIKQFDKEEYDALVVFGFGMGHHIKAFVDKYPDVPILVLESNQDIFVQAIKHADISDILINDNVKLIIGDDIVNQIKALFSKWLFEQNYPKCFLSALPSYLSLYHEEYNAINEVIVKIVNSIRISINTRKLLHKLWLRNTILNYRYTLNSLSAQDFIGEFQDKPLVIVSAGPSLQKNIDILKKIKDEVFIFAVGSSVGILKKHGIRADMAAFIDGHPVEEKVVNSGKGYFDYILYSSTIYNKILDNNEAKMIHIPLNVTELDEWVYSIKGSKIQTLFRSGPSVANVTYDIAVKWGFNPIILIGQDLAYQNDKSHADGAAQIIELSKEKNEKKFIKTKDIYGNDIFTDKGFMEMKLWFEGYNQNRTDLPQTINCTEGGLGIKGIPNRRLSDIANEIHNKIDNKTDFISKTYNENTKKTMKQIDVSKSFEELLEQINYAEEITRKRIEIMNNFVENVDDENYNDEDFEKLSREDDKLYKKLEKECSGLIGFLNIGNIICLFAKKNRIVLGKSIQNESSRKVADIKGTMNQLVEKLQDIWVVKGTIEEVLKESKQNNDNN